MERKLPVLKWSITSKGLQGLSIVLRTFVVCAILGTAANAERPVVEVLRCEPAEAPVLDGRLDDPVWASAKPAGGFKQYEPNVGFPMTEPTEFRLVCDGRSLYLGVWCFDRDPAGIVSRKMLRDGNIFTDDYIYFAIDSFLDRRNATVYSLNPNGTRWDAYATDNTSVDSNWDGIWNARTSTDGKGWKAEVQIPLHALAFDPMTDRWGFNMSRLIRRKNERGRWHRALPNIRTSMMSEAGDMSGIAGLKPALGLQFAPYLTLRNRHGETGNESWLGDIGGDIRYRLSPSLNATLSLNTDFAETEVDRRQLNFGRFPLFFPEKRDFFLEDKSAFQFGGLYNRNYGFRNGVLPFFSRRIGRDGDGNAEPIRLAAKLTGRAGDWNLGLLDAWSEVDGYDRNLFVGRASRPFGASSSAGLLATLGDPLDDEDAWTLGADLRLRHSDVLEGQILEGSAFILGSYAGGQSNTTDAAFGAVVSFPNDLLFLSAKFLQVGEDFDPALGFVRRKGMRGYATNMSWQPRPKELPWLRQFKSSLLSQHTTNLDNALESADYIWLPVQFEFESGEEFYLKATRRFDAPADSFTLFDKIDIPADDYWWTRYEAALETAGKRPVVGRLSLNWGDFYQGKGFGTAATANVALTKHFNLNANYSWDRLAFDDLDVEIHKAGLRGIVNWTPELSLINLIQFDSASNGLDWFSRLQWEYRNGQELFAVFNQGYLRDDGSFVEQETESVIKLGTTWWF